MRAILCDRFEGIGALRMGEAAEPSPADDEVLIDVHAASVSYMDYLMTTGGYQLRPTLPYVPGTDAAGVVASVGGRVERFRPGDRVACGNWFGGFAERMVAKASKSARIPDTVDFLVGSIVGVFAGAWMTNFPAEAAEAADKVMALVGEGKLRPRVDRVLPLEQAAEAMRAVAERSVQGRMVLKVR
ncbi:MAG: alcohol dehydrogenase catalytic domain-containing protein [Roseiarcus sp.]